MKKILSLILSAVLLLTAMGLMTGCGDKGITIAVPNDATNEARALLLLEANGIIKLKEGVGITATKMDIVENPYNVTIKELDAPSIPQTLADVDFAVINSNYAILAEMNPAEDSLAMEQADAVACQLYANILAVKEGRENEPIIKALVAALESQQVVDFINKQYSGSVISTVKNPGTGYNDAIDYAALAGQKITVAATATPHAEILEIVKTLLSEKNITVEIKVVSDYVTPNTMVDTGDVDANYFQHQPYLTDFNKENNTKIVSVSAVHAEPMGLYGGKQTSLDIFKK